MTPLAASNPVETIFPVVGTFLVATMFYAITAHVAARWVLGETPLSSAIGVGVAPAIVTLGLDPFGPAVVIPLALFADALAIHGMYERTSRETVGFVVVHVVVSLALAFAVLNLIRLLV